MALAVGTISCCFVLIGSSSARPRTAAAPSDLTSYSARFVDGCQQRCAAQGGDAMTCTQYCACTLSALRVEYPGDDDLAAWFERGTQEPDKVQAQVFAAQEKCSPRVPTMIATRSPAAQHPAPPPTPTSPAPRAPSAAQLKEFLAWADQARSAPLDVKTTEVCEGAGEPGPAICHKSVLGFGNAGASFSNALPGVSYDKTRARAVRVSATFDTLLTCADLVSSRTLRKWTKGNHHEACVITDGPLNGMQLLTVQAVRHTSYFIYYPEYVASDRSFRKLLGG